MSGSRFRRLRSSRKSSKKLSIHKRASLVRRDMLDNPSLTLTKASRNRKVDPRSVIKRFPTDFQKDSSGRIRVRPNDRSHHTLFIPGSKPGEEIPVPTKSARERRTIGRWMKALNTAGRGDFSKIRQFPGGQVVGGVRLPTDDEEIQRILTKAYIAVLRGRHELPKAEGLQVRTLRTQLPYAMAPPWRKAI
jgi:hypothetical protein